MSRLSNDQRMQALGMLESGLTQQLVTGIFDIVRKDQKHYRLNKTLNDRPRSRRPSVTMSQDRYISPLHMRNPKTFHTRPRVARICRTYVECQHIDVLLWPPYSSDMPPTEQSCTFQIGMCVGAVILQTLVAFQQSLEEEWRRIPQRRIQCLVGSMSMKRLFGPLVAAVGTRAIEIFTLNFAPLVLCSMPPPTSYVQ